MMTGYHFLSALVFLVAGAHCDERENSFKSLEERVRLLETIIEQQHLTNQKLEDRIEDLEHTVQDLQETKRPSMRRNVSSGEEALQEADIEEVNITLSNNTADDDYMVDLECPSHCLRQKLQNNGRPGLYRDRIAFHAYQSSNRCYSNREIIRYDREMMDFGEGYTPYDGIFDAPTSGVYVFTWTVATTKRNGWFVAQLIVDGEVRGSVTSDSDSFGVTESGLHPATGVVATYVDAGQHVFIKMIQVTGECGAVQSDALVRSTFSGWILF